MTPMREFALWVSGFAGANCVFHFMLGTYIWSIITFFVSVLMAAIYMEARP